MLEPIRRWLKPPPPVVVSARPADSCRLERFFEWLDDFPPDVVARCREWIHSDPQSTVILESPAELSNFKLRAGECLAAARTAVERLTPSLAAPARLVWSFEYELTHGLEEFEAEAVFGVWMTIELVRLVRPDSRRRKLLVAGRLRDEGLACAFTLTGLQGLEGAAAMLSLEALEGNPFESSRVPIIIFLAHREARTLATRPAHPIARSLARLVRGGRVRLGLLVSAGAEARTIEAPAEEVAPLSAVSEGAPVQFVRFERSCGFRVTTAMAPLVAAGLVVNCLPAAAGQAPRPYQKAGAYWPQSFDAMTPAATRADGVPLQVVLTPAGRGSLGNIWRARTVEGAESRFASLLDFWRIETYHRDLERTPEFGRRYHEYRVFNWPRPDPTLRVTLFDGGTLANTVRVGRLRLWLDDVAARLGRRCPPLTHDAWLTAARTEADLRLLPTERSGRRLQVDAHHYLDAVPRDGPLRPDYADFASFLPDSLGRTLELGSGWGQLARTLATRAASYVCLELEPRMLLGRDQQLLGASGDIHHLPFESESFQSVVANNVLEHAYDPVACLSEVRRVLRPGGRLFALIPLDALNPAYELRAHHWKADEENIALAMTMARLTVSRQERINLYDLGVSGSFPTCEGLACKVEAVKS